MAGKFELKEFGEINLNDPFFDSLKRNYPEFERTWFPKCVAEKRKALVFYDESGLGAFIATKEETEAINLRETTLPVLDRFKISTLRISERYRGQRLGEGAIGLLLWMWRDMGLEEIYVTVFPEHDDLILQLEKFGFENQGHTVRGEVVYLRSRRRIDYSTPYKSFPFISPGFQKGGYLIVNAGYHDTLFPYSKLRHTLQEALDMDVANGITKIYIGKQWNPHYGPCEPVFIYRKSEGNHGAPRYTSCLTSYASIVEVIPVKRCNQFRMSYDDYIALVGNKSVFSEHELKEKYELYKNLTVIKFLYCGYFGEGRNINMDWLASNHLWTTAQCSYPADVQLTRDQCSEILHQAKLSEASVFG